VALVRGDLDLALHLHPLAPIAVPALAALAVAASRPILSARRRRWMNGCAALLLTALLGVWGARLMGALGGPPHVDTYAEFLERIR